jgi:hypothetical protein
MIATWKNNCGVALDITFYIIYSKPAEAKGQLEVIKKLNFSLNLS